jgi:GntR family transcriptional regulator, transcriptional repressor for pyruvate dehydrogenase complex
MTEATSKPVDDDPFRRFFANQARRPTTAKLAQSIAVQIADNIFSSGMTPGDALPNEAVMLQRLEVSRATLRESLRILETQGIIAMRTGRGGGPIVAHPSRDSLAKMMSVNFRGLGVTFEEILVTRDTIEPALARAAAVRRTDDDVSTLTELTQAMEAEPWDSPAYSKLNRTFHNTIAISSQNRPLAVLWSAISTIADGQGVGTRWNEDLWTAGNAAHRRIVQAIKKQDPERAARAMGRHVHAFHDDMAKCYPELLSEPVKLFNESTGPVNLA